MSRLLVAGVVAVAVTLVPVAAAVELPSPPPVTTPAITTPAITTPVAAPLPPLPVPVPVPVPAPSIPPPPSPPVAAPPKPAVPSPPVSAPAQAERASTPAPAAPSTTSPATAPTPSPVTSVVVGARPARPGASQRARRRPATVVGRFRLARAGLVHIALGEEAPICRPIGRYVVRASRGVTVLRVRRRLGGHGLGAGTYRFVGTVRGTTVLNVRIRLAFPNGTMRVRHDRLADVCVPATTFSASPAPPPVSSASGAVAGTSERRPLGPPPATKPTTPFLPPVLHALNPDNAPLAVRALLFALLAGAVALLAAGSLPERVIAGAPAMGIVARRRRAVTLGGVALLIAAVLVTLFG